MTGIIQCFKMIIFRVSCCGIAGKHSSHLDSVSLRLLSVLHWPSEKVRDVGGPRRMGRSMIL